jgi:hypothetical protein
MANPGDYFLTSGCQGGWPIGPRETLQSKVNLRRIESNRGKENEEVIEVPRIQQTKSHSAQSASELVEQS